ncbi:Boron transporter 1 [Nakaseomyces bracarensis]|uniref:Boron transporter 1 n=1 Tax=Nakaseomyces bracarensis TaxID=273131 RepID=A0ABR4NQC7_9SACH
MIIKRHTEMIQEDQTISVDSSYSGEDSERIDSSGLSDTEKEVATLEQQEFPKRKHKLPKPGIGIWLDLKDRIPWYWQDWKDSWDYRVIPSVIETYFNNLLPAIAFAQDMFDRTDKAYGVNEVLLASAMGGIVFGILAGQPLCIVGVTGPITIFNYTVFEIIKPLDTNYFGFIFWIYIWSMIFDLILAFSNAVCLLQYVTQFPCDIFGLFINIVYLQKGVQILTKQFRDKDGNDDPTAGFANVVVAISMTVIGTFFKLIKLTPILNARLRTVISDYSTALSVLFWSAFLHFGGYLRNVDFQKLPISKAYHPTSGVYRDRSTWLAYEKIPVRDVFIALPFGIILSILFYFDHSVSSLMAQKEEYKLKKPSSFHYDFALLGLTTGVSGVLGIPAPNGLIPQAPLHTESLLVHDKDENVVRCVEQRFTNTVQGALMLVTMSRGLLVCLGEIPQAVLSGLFMMMGIQGLVGNEIIHRIIWVFTEERNKSRDSILHKVPLKKLILFICFSLIGFVGEFAITDTIAAIGFPLILLLTVIGCFAFPYFFTQEELAVLDSNVAQEFTIKNLLLKNIGGAKFFPKKNEN